MKKLRCFFILMALFAVGAVTDSCPAADAARVEREAREIEANLIAPCCWTQPVSEHYSEAADKIRNEVREMLAAGRSREEIMDYYVARYGERILAAPRAKGFNRLAYLLPWIALIAGAGVVLFIIKKLRAPAPVSRNTPVVDPRYASEVEKEINRLEE